MASLRNQFRLDETDPKSLQAFAVDNASIPYMEAPARGSDWVDKVVKLNAAGEIQKCADNNAILGVLEQVTPVKSARVQIHGLRVLSCTSGATFTMGDGVVADAFGGVKAAGAGLGFGRALYKVTTTSVLVDL